MAGASGLLLGTATLEASSPASAASVLIPMQIWVGSISIFGQFNYWRKIVVNAPYLVAYTALSEVSFNTYPNNFGRFVNTFAAYNLQSDPWYADPRPWWLPFFSGASIRSITVELNVWGNTYNTVAPHQLTLFSPSNITSAATSMSIEDRPKKAIVVYDTANGKIKLLYEVVNLADDDLPDAATLEAEARRARENIKETFSAGVLPIDITQLKREVYYEVDLATRTLRERTTQ
jgi:hypothetical protein